MNRKLIFLLMIPLVFAFSCVKKPSLFSSDGTMDEFDPSYLDYTYLNARARIVLEEQNGRLTRGTLHVRAKKDSVLWFSLSPGLGIEAARGLLTREEIKIKDRINGTNIDMSYREFEEKYGIKLSLDLFQNIFLANIPYEFNFRDRLLRIGKNFELSQTRENVTYSSKISTSHGKVVEMESVSAEYKGKLSASYPEFKNVENQPFPYKILIKMLVDLPGKPTTNTIVNLEVARADLMNDPLSFPYNF